MSFLPNNDSKLQQTQKPFGTKIIMVPSIHGQHNIFASYANLGLDYPMHASHISQYQSPCPYVINPNLHGNENNKESQINQKSITMTSLDTYRQFHVKPECYGKSGGPIDLSPASSEVDDKSIVSVVKILEVKPLKSPKKEPKSPNVDISDDDEDRIQRKRKSLEPNDDEWISARSKSVSGIPRQAGNKREEVLKAARSLFSKRTRTLYHWLYPNTSKTQLKATVAAAWDTLSTAEKDFYISQVLGRFGVPAGSLMVNPQLGGFTAAQVGNIETHAQVQETRCAVSNLLLAENDVKWSSHSQASTANGIKRKRRLGNKIQNGDRNDKRQDEETLILKQIRDEALDDEFADDPELSKEFEQFRLSTQSFLDSDLLTFNLDDILSGI